MTQIARMRGYIRAAAEQSHPLQTKLQLILTDFMPNGNKQAIPVSEKENIVRSALFMPVKINFDGQEYTGHADALPIGPITKVFEGMDENREVVKAEAIIWNEMFSGVAEHLKEVFSEGIGTSWEIYYSDSQIDNSGVEWLQDCVFAGTCVVETPAYGPQRTRILAIAETLKNNEEEMPKDKVQADSVEVVQENILDAQDLLFQLWDGLDALFAATFEIAKEETEKNIETIANTFAQRISEIADGIKSLRGETAELKTKLETATSELNTYHQGDIDRAKAEKLKTRRDALAEVGIVYTDEVFSERVSFIESMSDSTFDIYVSDFASLKQAKAEMTNGHIIALPEPIGITKKVEISELAAAIRKR